MRAVDDRWEAKHCPIGVIQHGVDDRLLYEGHESAQLEIVLLIELHRDHITLAEHDSLSPDPRSFL